jgi:two-component system alkaline phosphatase synthesis response regulator PhoP
MTPGHKILFVDDDRDFLGAQEAFFRGRGYAVITHDRTSDAVERAREEKPDVIVLDLMMEHHDSGFVLARKLRQEPSLATVPILMLSGVASATGHKFSEDTRSLKEWMKLDAFLDKPITGRQLVKVIEEKLGLAMR